MENTILSARRTPLKRLVLDRSTQGNVETESKDERITAFAIDPAEGDSTRIWISSFGIRNLTWASAAEQTRYPNLSESSEAGRYLVSLVQMIAEERRPGHRKYWNLVLILAGSETEPGRDVYVYALCNPVDSDGKPAPRYGWCASYQHGSSSSNRFSERTGGVYLFALFSFQGASTRMFMEVEDWMEERFNNKIRWRKGFWVTLSTLDDCHSNDCIFWLVV